MKNTVTKTDMKPRCLVCSRALAGFVTRPWEIRCRKCGAVNFKGKLPDKPFDKLDKTVLDTNNLQ